MSTLRETLRQRSPRLYKVLRTVAVRVLIEYKVLRQFRPGMLRRAILGHKSEWEKVLPLQSPPRLTLEAAGFLAGDLALALEAEGVRGESGNHAVYLTPEAWRRSSLGPLAARYPADAGLKIMRNRGGLETGYLHGDGHSALQHRALHGHPHLMLVANLLARMTLGPRLYDLVELSAGEHLWVAYVVRHAPGGSPTTELCEDGLRRLRQLAEDRRLAVIAPGGFGHSDFAPPSCNGNARTDATGRFQYVDFQNFALIGYDRLLRGIAEEAASASHFGDRSYLRGGSYLYQSIPGLALPAKRDVARRIPVISGLLAEAGGAILDRVVLDVGCNIGMMIGQYLRLGARWCHGWDRGAVVPHTDRLLSALGCTRYSLTGGDIASGRDLSGDLPAHLGDQLNGCVISYLAVRGHLGWLSGLARLPWGFLIYEGHEGEGEEATRRHLAEFQAAVPCEITGVATYRDGDSDPRMVALLRRGGK